MNSEKQTKRTQNDRSIYCIVVIHLKRMYAGADFRIDQYAELVGIDDNIATFVSRKYGISKEDIDFVSISFATNSNAHLGFCGHVTDVVLDNGAAVYTVEIPKTKQLDLKNGTIIELPNENLIKYNNIHKAKHSGPRKKKQCMETEIADDTPVNNEGAEKGENE